MTSQPLCSTLERKLVHHCSPTLAGLKPAKLFVCREGLAADGEIGESTAGLAPESCAFSHELALCRKKLEPCGVRIEVLARRKTGLLLYVYRPTMLRNSLAQPKVAHYLRREGLHHEVASSHLRHRLGRHAFGQLRIPARNRLFPGLPLPRRGGIYREQRREQFMHRMLEGVQQAA